MFSIGLDTWQLILLTILILLCINYLYHILIDKLIVIETTSAEGFIDTAASSSTASQDPYDDFYASIYHKIFQHDRLVQAEAALAFKDWERNTPPQKMNILDCGCGTGVATCYFAKQGVGTVVGLDRAPAMLRFAQSTILPSTTLTEQQMSAVSWKQGDAYGPSNFIAGTFSHAALLYFTVYCFRDLDALFKNLALWVRPGGGLVIEAVNKYKFEPVPDIANPWVAVSPQKYSKHRITTARAAFDKFDYETEFDLEDPRAEYREIFRFKDGSIRRQTHVLWMPSIAQIVEKAKAAGWVYQKFTDLEVVGFNYGYLLFFTRGQS
jgi:SAM-dependent methyltransferase